MMDLLTYQQWDFVADAYIPILAAASLYQIWKSIKQKSSVWNGSGIRPMLWSVVIVYLVMKIDAATGIWSSLELDYSTHLALSLALAFPLVRGFWPWRFLVLLSILLYASLMVYQNYHTTEDLLTTTLVVLPVLWFLTANANSRNKLNRSGQIPRTTEHSPTG
ncbi:MAG: hypothetical protein HOH43_24000 [Candidatus Latescibacteria bacterium]|jgi:hypothetical protein|nr:hypothetical protein [Candidatus Latescibacterota bacterium]